MSCRALSKYIPTSDSAPAKRSEALVFGLKRYEWILKYAPALCERKNLIVDDIFSEEIQICKDMVELLPSKIDRMHFLGEKGLTL